MECKCHLDMLITVKKYYKNFFNEYKAIKKILENFLRNLITRKTK